jgi:multidrug transporter EmrE-like cation transporter
MSSPAGSFVGREKAFIVREIHKNKAVRSIILYGMVALAVAIEVTGDALLKQSVKGGWAYVVDGILLYSLLVFPVALAYKYTEFGTLFIIWEVVGTVIGLGVGTWYFGEAFTVSKALSLVLACAALFFCGDQ